MQTEVISSHASAAADDMEMFRPRGESVDRPDSQIGTFAGNTAPQASEGRIPQWKSIAIVASSFMVIFTCCGQNFAFGVYQALYEEMALQPDTPFTGATPAQIDLIGTISIALMTIGAPFSVAWAKRFSPRLVSLLGGVIFSAALVLASFGTRLWHFEVTQGFLLGVGTCLPYMVAVTVAPGWFSTRRGLAMGIVLSGTGVGGVVWAPAIKALVGRVGFRNSLRVAGALSFVLVTVSSIPLAWDAQTQARLNVENAARSHRADGIFNVPLVDWRVAKSRSFLAQSLGAVFQAAAYYTPVFFFASYASTLGYSAAAGANFIALSNACNAVGKIAIGFFADRMGRLNTMFLTTLFSAVITVCFWLPSTYYGSTSDSRGLFIAFTVFYGLFASAYVSLFPASLVEIFGAQNFASVNGFLYMIRGMATLVGTPVSGILIRGGAGRAGPGAYLDMSVFVSVLLFAATASVLWVRIEAMIGSGNRMTFKWKA
ncbi:MFS monocarboxylate transporter [Niveomyces insectorum RCEF 264]|uniref:MFS monocarboxylate transporter n=1 Tax=Niveomyces insectorum RCEF 264 TaxID=1081102 RepID=A0A167TUE6_9HYPO|nr:MFS monocarboxylate transporter [Niveomyces insectorum RCEF 264]